MIQGISSFSSGRHLIADSYVSKGTSHHDFVVASTATKGIEIAVLNAPFGQPMTSRAVGREGASGRDVIGGDGISQLEQNFGVMNRLNGFSRCRKTTEKGREANVS